jgi:hypothetical protein
MQILVHKCGFHYPHEPLATHARFRYRIVSGPGQIDPNLWIVHYSQAEQSHRIPSSQIPIPQNVHQQLGSRAQLQAAGPLMRKEFMLEDRANWPEVKFGQPAARGQGPVYNPMMRQPYTNQPPPTKKPRTLPQQVRHPAAAVIDQSLEEEENSTQDTFDFMTPREISLSRYKQHHEWMEEIFSSPYGIGRIEPIDLGLGLMGELGSLTEGILDAPGAEAPIKSTAVAFRDDQMTKPKAYTVKSYSKLDPDQLKVFEARVAEYTAKEEAELEKMRVAHAKRIADLKRSRTYIKAERRLRDIPRTGEAAVDTDGADPFDGVVQELERTLGMKFDTKKHVICVEKGGFIEQQQPPPQKSPQVNGNGTMQSNPTGGSHSLGDEGALDVDNSAASLLDQYGSGSLGGTPANLSIPQISQPQSQSQSAVATPNAAIGDSMRGSSFVDQDNIEATSGADDLLDLDVEMSGMPEDKGGEGDWVMVGDQATGSGQQSRNNEQTATSTNASVGLLGQSTSTRDPDPSAGIFDTGDFGDFDNLDTAGDALADYSNVDDTMGLDLVDDSAFGDAFHGTEPHHESGDGDNV